MPSHECRDLFSVYSWSWSEFAGNSSVASYGIFYLFIHLIYSFAGLIRVNEGKEEREVIHRNVTLLKKEHQQLLTKRLCKRPKLLNPAILGGPVSRPFLNLTRTFDRDLNSGRTISKLGRFYGARWSASSSGRDFGENRLCDVGGSPACTSLVYFRSVRRVIKPIISAARRRLTAARGRLFGNIARLAVEFSSGDEVVHNRHRRRGSLTAEIVRMPWIPGRFIVRLFCDTWSTANGKTRNRLSRRVCPICRFIVGPRSAQWTTDVSLQVYAVLLIRGSYPGRAPKIAAVFAEEGADASHMKYRDPRNIDISSYARNVYIDETLSIFKVGHTLELWLINTLTLPRWIFADHFNARSSLSHQTSGNQMQCAMRMYSLVPFTDSLSIIYLIC